MAQRQNPISRGMKRFRPAAMAANGTIEVCAEPRSPTSRKRPLTPQEYAGHFWGFLETRLYMRPGPALPARSFSSAISRVPSPITAICWS